MKELFFTKEILNSNRVVQDKILSYTNRNKSYTVKDILNLKSCFNSSCELQVFDLLIEHLIKAEKISPNGSNFFIHMIKKNELEVKPKIFRKENLYSLIKTFSSKNIDQIVIDALNLAGYKGKITIANSSSNVDVVELTTGSFFEEIVPAFNISNQLLNEVRVICIDGYIESVSEIHHLLEEASEKKETVALFLRGLSDDVIHTLKVNFDRGTIKVIPFIVKFDLDGANLLNDIAVISCSDVVSTFKGELISSISISKSKFIDSLEIYKSGILLNNNNSIKHVDKHIKFLQEKIIISENDATKEALTKRIQRLALNQVAIKLADTKDFTEKSFGIDRCIRAVKSSSSFGIFTFEDSTYPLASILAGKFYKNKFDKLISELGVVIKN